MNIKICPLFQILLAETPYYKKNEQEQEEKQEKEDDKSRRNLIDLEDDRVSVVILSWSLILEQSTKTLLKKNA